MSVSNITDLSERREMKANRHAIRGPHGRFIKPDEYDRYVQDEERRIANLVAPRSENEAPDLRPMTAPKHFIPAMEPVPVKTDAWNIVRISAAAICGFLVMVALWKLAGH